MTITMKAKVHKTYNFLKCKLSGWATPVVFIIVFAGFFSLFAVPMGFANMINTIMNTSYRLLMDTVLFIMAIAVIMGAISALMTEFGVVDFLNRIFSPFMQPVYGLPGAAALGIITTYLSDNPAILSLVSDKGFSKAFKKYQLLSLTNLGTAFGMGLIVSTFMLGLGTIKGDNFAGAIIIGNVGAIIGSIISTRLIIVRTKKIFGDEPAFIPEENPSLDKKINSVKHMRDLPAKQRLGIRIVNSLLEGGERGIKVGISIIPGVLIMCTFVMMLTNGNSSCGYTGAAFEGIGLIPRIADALSFILKPLFGFSSPDAIAVPITALGSAGAAIALVPSMITSGSVTAHDISVFTSMCMCWSGYLSTHVSMMQAMNHPELSGKAIFCHTIGGIAGGVAANWLYKLFALIF